MLIVHYECNSIQECYDRVNVYKLRSKASFIYYLKEQGHKQSEKKIEE